MVAKVLRVDEEPKRKWWHVDITLMVIVFMIVKMFVFPWGGFL